MSLPSRSRHTVEQFLQATISGRPEEIADCYAGEVVIEMPFAVAPLYPARIATTREQLRARFAAGAAIRRYTALAKVAIHETTDPEVVVVEYELQGHMVATGATFALAFAMVLTIRDGLIVHSRDYTDPIAGARALDKLPDLVAALTDRPAEPAA
jgi:ketosteroid isomerase-like protein